ncbi:glycosyltransferase family 4 protein [Candidatus Beckwithbacteria bacterium]|nr:glycosyltransferase family 4 protein [Candidatus Beckwithbacteria bacterium]
MNLPQVFMIGWEFPPHNSGGLGTACHGLITSLSNLNIPQTFVLPKALPLGAAYLQFCSPTLPNVQQIHINMELKPYSGMTREQSVYLKRKPSAGSMIEDAYAYAEVVGHMAARFPHNLIHSHDWMTYPAAFAANNVSHMPTILHVHSTEFDRTLNGAVNQQIAEIEYESLQRADQIIAVSNYTKQMVANKYAVDPNKIAVVHNGVDLSLQRQIYISNEELQSFAKGRKLVIFMGRLTAQKGPDYFIAIASQIARAVPNVLFVVAGDGDMYNQIIMQSAQQNLTGKLLYAGFLRDRQREFLYRRADLFIMPSVSEPFGIVALEAAAAYTPIIISKQSGVSEVMPFALSANYWDTDDLAGKAITILQNPELAQSLVNQGLGAVENINWHQAAQKCVHIYNQVLG